MLFAVLTFALVFGIIVGSYWYWVARPEQSAESSLRRRVHMQGVRQQTLRLGVQREVERLSSLPMLNRILSSRSAISEPVHALIEQSGVKTSVGTILLSTASLFMIGVLAGQWWLGSTLVGVAMGTVLGAGPYAFLRWKRYQRLQRFEELFPEALSLMSRAMRAGHTFITALGMVADEMPQPIAAEFRLLHDRQNFGLPLPEALRDFAQRVPVLPARFFATAVLTQRESGGNLSEVLDNLATVIRERFTVLRQVRVKSAHGRMTGWILTGLPPAAALALGILNPGHFKNMVGDLFGIQMIVAALVLQVVGALIIRKIVNVEY